jgi:WD40 repeat protein
VALSVSPGGQYLACLDSTGRLEFFDAKTGKSESTYSDKITGIGVSFISDSELVTTGDPEPLRIKVPRPE